MADKKKKKMFNITSNHRDVNQTTIWYCFHHQISQNFGKLTIFGIMKKRKEMQNFLAACLGGGAPIWEKSLLECDYVPLTLEFNF